MRRWKKHYLHPINKFMECAENMQGKGNYLTSCLPPIKGALSVAARTFCFRVWRVSEIVCVKNQILCYRGHILIHTKDKGIWLLEGLRQTQGLTRTSQGSPSPAQAHPQQENIRWVARKSHVQDSLSQSLSRIFFLNSACYWEVLSGIFKQLEKKQQILILLHLQAASEGLREGVPRLLTHDTVVLGWVKWIKGSSPCLLPMSNGGATILRPHRPTLWRHRHSTTANSKTE